MIKNSLNGIEESILLTEKFKQKLKLCFHECFSKDEALLLCWGSMARKEMGPFSDLDLILILSRKTNNRKVKKFHDCLSRKLINRIDLLEAYDLKTLSKIGSIDGTDRQAILLARPVCGNSKLKKDFLILQNIFHNQVHENMREILHTWSSLFSVSKNIYINKSNNLKFSLGFLRHVIFILLIVKLFFDKKNVVWSTQKAITILGKLGEVNNDTQTAFLTSLNFILEFRNKVQFFMKNESYYIDNNLLNGMAKKSNCSVDFLKSRLEDNRSNIVLSSKDINKVISRLICKKSTAEFQKYENLLNILIDFEKEINFETEEIIMDTKQEILLVLLAHRSKNPRILETLRKNNMTNWYIVYGIAINLYSSPQTLLKLVKPENKAGSYIYKLYDSFAWRNIRLYVAKNKIADKKVLNYIFNHKNSRQMDKEAALYTLTSKR
ncbi:MAG: hypothetical protein UU01_C0034G0007 [Parcubacteria group bacterium GW2011_GWA2_40_37]|nr:MAG: hypothetical protein UU01_C0034G0007 [Parcubacteria group bacterium GW2011_GWA2_40_37]